MEDIHRRGLGRLYYDSSSGIGRFRAASTEDLAEMLRKVWLGEDVIKSTDDEDALDREWATRFHRMNQEHASAQAERAQQDQQQRQR